MNDTKTHSDVDVEKIVAKRVKEQVDQYVERAEQSRFKEEFQDLRNRVDAINNLKKEIIEKLDHNAERLEQVAEIVEQRDKDFQLAQMTQDEKRSLLPMVRSYARTRSWWHRSGKFTMKSLQVMAILAAISSPIVTFLLFHSH